MFRRIGVLALLSIVFFIACWYLESAFKSGKGNEYMVSALQKYLDVSQEAFNDLAVLDFDEILEYKEADSRPYAISMFKGDSLVWWTNSNLTHRSPKPGIYRYGTIWLMHRKVQKNGYSLELNVPFLLEDPNRSRLLLYPDGQVITGGTQCSEMPGGYPVAFEGLDKTMFLHFDALQKPAKWSLFLFLFYILAYGFAAAFFALAIDNITERFQYRQAGPLFLFALLLVVRFVWNQQGLSALLEETLEGFYPPFIANQGALGDHLINLFLLFWLLLYTFKRLQDFRFDHLPVFWKAFLAAINYFGTLTALILFARTLKGMLEGLPFDINLIYYPHILSLLYLFTLALLLCLFFIISHRMAFVVSRLKLSLNGKLVSMFFAFGLILPFYINLDIGFPIYLMYLASFSYLLLSDLFIEIRKPSIAWLLVWLILFSGFTSVLMHRFYDQKTEKESVQVALALTSPSDRVLEKLWFQHYLPIFSESQFGSEQDVKSVLNQVFMSDPYINTYYTWSIFLGSSVQALQKEAGVNDPTRFHFDLSFGGITPGVVEFVTRKEIQQPGYLADNGLAFRGIHRLSNYVFAWEQSDTLVMQHGATPEAFRSDTFMMPDLVKGANLDRQWFQYPTASGGLLWIGRGNEHFSYRLSFFSLMFVVLVLSLLFLSVVNTFYSFLPDQMALRFIRTVSLHHKLQFSFIGIIVFSFICVGSISLYYFKRENKLEIKDRLKELASLIQQDNASDASYGEDPGRLHPIGNSLLLKTELSSGSDIPSPILLIHLATYPHVSYEAYRSLTGRSRGGVLYDAVLAEETRNFVSVHVNHKATSEVISLNQSLADSDPLQGFIGNLINLYVFLLIIAIAIALFMSQSLVAPIVRLGQKMQSTKLGRKNEPLVWNQKDELGVLISQYNNMVESLEKSAEMIAQNEREIAWREMAKQVAHEIKNPLTPMKLSIQHLESKIGELPQEDIPAFVKRVSTTLIEQIDNLTRIATEFSSFSKLPEPNNEKITVNDLVSSVHDLFRKREDILFNLYVPIDEIYIYADRSHVLRILNNLIKNAIQAIPEGRKGKMDIKLFTRKGYAVIQVSDNGEGIPADMRDKVFFPNFTTKSSGTGLGLAICKDVVESYGGRIYFESTAGKGSDFFVEFPLYLDETIS
jgi:two-component system, NtrC family, nitrogen regulation sensor histidine kinase NtrY